MRTMARGSRYMVLGGAEPKWNETFFSFALREGFAPRLCPPYASWVKGKVERPIRFIVPRGRLGPYLTTMADLVAKLKTDESSGRNTNVRSYHKAGLVIVEEAIPPLIGRSAISSFVFLSRRYKNASLVITSNKNFTALLDRLLHHSVIITIRGQSYRLKGKLAQTRKPGTEN